MNSSSVAASAVSPAFSRRAIWLRSTSRGLCTSGSSVVDVRSAISMAVPGSHGMRRNVSKSGFSTMSPYPVSQLESV